MLKDYDNKPKREAPVGRYLAALIAPRVGEHSTIALDVDTHGDVAWTPVPAWKGGPTVIYTDRTGHACYGWAEYRIRGVPFRTRWYSDGSGNAPAIWIRLGGKSYQIKAHYARGYKRGQPEPRGGGYLWSDDGNTILDTRPPDAVQDYGEPPKYDGRQLDWFRYYLMAYADGGYPWLYLLDGTDPVCHRCATLAAFKGERVSATVYHEGPTERCTYGGCSQRIRAFYRIED